MSAVSLTGCVYDAAVPRVTFANESAEAVVVALVWADGAGRLERHVPAGDATDAALSECEERSELVVTAEDDSVIGTVDGPICPGWTLTIGADGALAFEER